jgi:hypothetical protein
MSHRNHKSCLIILGSIFLIFPDSAQLKNTTLNTIGESDSASGDYYETTKLKGYNSVTGYNDMFLAAGSEGRIDWISFSGKITRTESFAGEEFNCIISDNKNIIVAGEKGVIRISVDGKSFGKVESGTVRDINSVIIFNSTIIGGADGGIIILGNQGGSFNALDLNLKGNIVSLSARSSDCYGVTDAGEIIHSVDGIHWDIFDYNRVYSGYYKPCSFTGVLVTQNRIAVAGRQDDDSPVVAFSNQGNVWTERILSYTNDQGSREFLTEIPNSIIYDEAGDQFILGCDNGTLILLPPCSQCNKVSKVSDTDLRGLSLIGSKMLVVGDDYFTRMMNFTW